MTKDATRPLAVIAGAGPGISEATAHKFASQGFNIALLSRTQSKLDALAAEIVAKNPDAQARGYAVDLRDQSALAEAFKRIEADALGKITVLLWNPYGQSKPLRDPAVLKFLNEEFNAAVVSLIAAVQLALPSLLTATNPAVLVTGGGLSLENEPIAELAVAWGAGVLAISKAAQRKAVHVLHKDLGKDGIYVGEVTVLAAVKGTPFDADGKATITKEAVADDFWRLYTERDQKVTFVSRA
ncbi:hypothetical protein DFJ74DRAFT_678129 [Hyaloraphidium curvatum]|nr:hypothetical protein DFJ74DRAFT_678129 [Hyaloraphidium curvatum]